MIAFFLTLEHKSIIEIGTEIIHPFMDAPVDIVKDCIKIVYFSGTCYFWANDINILELFHGPTLAFKDFGARFMAQTMAYYRGKLRSISW